MRVEKIEDLKSGDFRFSGDRLTFLCPCGCGHTVGFKIAARDLNAPLLERCWNWNGDFDKPTCQPSIVIAPDRPDYQPMAGFKKCQGWHGHMTDGQLCT